MSIAWREAAKKALPGPVLSRVRAARWALRHWRHRMRWLLTGRRTPGIGLGRFDGRLVAYRLHTVDTAVIFHSFDRDIFFPAIPDARVEPADTILDVGAHIGTFALLASERVPQGRVFAIEASRDTFDLLHTNLELNGRANVTAEHLALAGADGPVTLHHDPEGNYGHSITRPLSDSSEVVQGVTLMRYLDSRGITRVKVAKFNCEGAEFPILLASPAAVLRRIECLLILYHCDLAQTPLPVLIEHVQAAGFETATRTESADRGWLIARRR